MILLLVGILLVILLVGTTLAMVTKNVFQNKSRKPSEDERH